jgi:acyl carrier protein
MEIWGDPAFMATQTEEIFAAAKAFILAEFLRDEDPDALDGSTPLISAAILDSVATIKLVMFLEETYGIEFEPHEMGIDDLNTLTDICATVQSKLANKN